MPSSWSAKCRERTLRFTVASGDSLFSTYIFLVPTRREFHRQSLAALVVADHSKFDRTFPSRYLPWRDVDHLVTDAEPEGSLMSSLKLNEVAVTVG